MSTNENNQLKGTSRISLSLTKSTNTKTNVDKSGTSASPGSFDTSTPIPCRADMEEFLSKKLAELKKPPVIHEATPLLAQELARSDNLWCREIRDYDLINENATIQWTRQQDADLVALALAHANSAHDMRKINTYRSIEAQFLSGNPSADNLRYRLNYLCHERNIIKLENLCGYINSNVELNDADKTRNDEIKKAAKRLRAAVLNLEDVHRWNLMEDMSYYIQSKKRINNSQKKHIISRLQKQKDHE